MNNSELIQRLNETTLIKCCVIFYQWKQPYYPVRINEDGEKIKLDPLPRKWQRTRIIHDENKKWKTINQLINQGHDYYVHEFLLKQKIIKPYNGKRETVV